jgi:hypothetical protein
MSRFSRHNHLLYVRRQPVTAGSNRTRRPDRFSQKEQNSSAHRQPALCSLAQDCATPTNGALRTDGFQPNIEHPTTAGPPPTSTSTSTFLTNEPHSTHKLNSQLHTNHIIIIIRIHIYFNININPLLTFQPSTLSTGLPIEPSIP